MSVNVLYKTSAKATGGRDGHAATLDGALDVKLTTPKELGGGGGAGNNPEQLFAAGYAACFIGAMKFVASQGGPKVPADASVTSTVGIGPRSAGGFGLDIDLAVSLPGLAARGRRGAGGEGPSGMPLLQRDPRQCGCSPDGRLTDCSNGPPDDRRAIRHELDCGRRARARICAQPSLMLNGVERYPENAQEEAHDD